LRSRVNNVVGRSDRLNRVEFECAGIAAGHQQIGISTPIASERKVIPNDNVARLEAVDQHAIDEFVSGQF